MPLTTCTIADVPIISEVVRSRTDYSESFLFFALSSALAQAIPLPTRGSEKKKPMEMPHTLRKGQPMGQYIRAGISPAAEYFVFPAESLMAQPWHFGRGELVAA